MFYLIASTYGSDSYNVSNYNGATSTANPGTGTGSSVTTGGGSAAGVSGGGNTNLLANTGFDIMLIVTLAALVTLAAIVVRIWKRPSRITPGK